MSNHLPLAPMLSPETQDILNEPGLLRSWTIAFGSPLHVILPGIAGRNAQAWRTAMSRSYESTEIRFALKSCKSSAVVKAFGLSGLGADVSSSGELQRAIGGYVSPSRISFTGPEKPDHDLMVCLSAGIAIHADTPCEAERIAKLAKATGTSPRVMLRYNANLGQPSRFGMSDHELMQCAASLHAQGVTLEGIAFHLSGYDLDDRIGVTRRCVALVALLAAAGISCRAIDIGGGFPMRYLQADVDDVSVDMLPRWGGSSMKGDYPYHAAVGGPEAAAAVLDGILLEQSDRTTLQSLGISIIMEPGRALLDQCGFSAFRVIGKKVPMRGIPMLVLDGMNFSLSETWFGADFLPAPFLVNDRGCFPCTGSRLALAGRSCMESDFIRRIGVDFAVEPAPGDLIVFVNTAGYQMDSNESRFHDHPLPRKIAATQTPSGWQHLRDEIYSIKEFQDDHITYQ